ncbi:MAG: hypothetical protein ACFWTM_02050 [Mitsuokella multacida]|jgi:hypothetical protein
MKNAFPAMHCHCFKDISLKSQRRMMQDASRGKWYNLVRLRDIPAFAAWLTDDFHEWTEQSPDVGEALRAQKNGMTIVVWYDGRRTICGRHAMLLWHTFCCFREDILNGTAPGSVSAEEDSADENTFEELQEA